MGIISDQPFYRKLLESIEHKCLNDYIEIVDAVGHEEMADIFDCHDALIFPSVGIEGSGVTILEALAAGLPVFCSGSGGSRELVNHRLDGFIYNSAEECARYIEKIITDKEMFNKAREHGRRKIEEHFDITDPADNQLAFNAFYAILVLKNYERCKNNKTARFV